MYLAVEALEWLRIDDPIGAVPVHGINGIWGTLSLGLFACGRYGATGPLAADNSTPLTGLLYGGGTTLLMAQLIGSAIVTGSTFGVAYVVMYLVNAMGLLACPARANCMDWTSTNTGFRHIRNTSFPGSSAPLRRS